MSRGTAALTTTTTPICFKVLEVYVKILVATPKPPCDGPKLFQALAPDNLKMAKTNFPCACLVWPE